MIIDELVEMLQGLNSNKEIWDTIAKAYRNSFDALVRVGFTEEQAITILSRQGVYQK